MGKFSVNIAALDQAASELSATIDELESIIVTYNALHTRMGESWDGAASEAFLNGMMRNREKMRESFRALLSYRSAIKKLAQKLRDMDEEEERLIRMMESLGTLGGLVNRNRKKSGGTVYKGSSKLQEGLGLSLDGALK